MLKICRLPTVPLEPCEKRAARVSSMAFVRYRANDYSVPTTYAFQEVLVKGFVEEVVKSFVRFHARSMATRGGGAGRSFLSARAYGCRGPLIHIVH